MLQTLQAPEQTAGAIIQPSASNDDGAPGAMNFTAATTLMRCRVALAKSPAASRGAFSKHQTSISPELARALELVGSYTHDVRKACG
jgi:hypothetical protein